MSFTPITASTLHDWLKTQQVMLIDVREPGEFAARHIAGAVSMPLGTIGPQNLPQATGKKLVIYCEKGGRGNTACQKLSDEGTDHTLYNLEGGIQSWSAAGLPVVTSQRILLPLDQQVQLTIGLMLIASTIAGYVMTPNWFILAGCIGAGLTVAGLTGFCGLARLMAKMPWNQKA
jgi:rhodanese-related sulfurtransferase